MVLISLQCVCKTYSWGLRYPQSIAGCLYAANSLEQIKEDLSYAELWMGTHPSGCSMDKETKASLGEILEKTEVRFPLLLKVLSVSTPLSIQAHPDRTKAELLHKTNPSIYPDSNNKPEMIVALEPVELLIGFYNQEQIYGFISQTPELMALLSLSSDDVQQQAFSCQELFCRLMKTTSSQLKRLSNVLLKRLEEKNVLSQAEKLFERLSAHFKEDVGCFCVFFMNFVSLKKGESIFIDENIPHAYLSGQMVECMVSSDNVVRAGLTPKYRDTETLCTMLSYQQQPVSLVRAKRNGKKLLYTPEKNVFSIGSVELEKEETEEISVPRSGMIVFCISGDGVFVQNKEDFSFCFGTVFFTSSSFKIKGKSNKSQFYWCCL